MHFILGKTAFLAVLWAGAQKSHSAANEAVRPLLERRTDFISDSCVLPLMRVGRPMHEFLEENPHFKFVLASIRMRVSEPPLNIETLFSGLSVTSVYWNINRLFNDLLMVEADAPRLFRELTKLNERRAEGGLSVWDHYLISYDHILPFATSYLESLNIGESYLPKEGTIAVLGTGPGNDTIAFRARNYPKRKIIAFDSSAKGLSIARQKLDLVGFDQVRLIQRDIMRLNYNQQWDGAYMNNVLYALPNQRRALQIIYRGLKPGGVLVFANPVRAAVEPFMRREIMRNVFKSAYANRSVATIYDYLLFATVNYGVLMDPKLFLEPEQMQAMLHSVGFVDIETSGPIYYASSRMYIARKPK